MINTMIKTIANLLKQLYQLIMNHVCVYKYYATIIQQMSNHMEGEQYTLLDFYC